MWSLGSSLKAVCVSPQALDEEYLKVDAQFGGVDQRKIFTFAEKVRNGVCEFPAMLVSGSGLAYLLIHSEKRVCDFSWHHSALRSFCCCSRGLWGSGVRNSHTSVAVAVSSL